MTLKKYFSSSNKNAPQITNSIGCLIPVLDYVLCNGSTPEAVASISEHDGFYTVATLLANGYQAHQTLSFTGVINGEYIIREVIDGQRFKVKKTIDDPVLNNVVANTTCKLNALGFDKAFSGVNKAVYQSSDLSEACRPYLRVDDGSIENYPDTWVKAAMVGMLEECNGIDDFNSGYGHQPLGLSYQENWEAYTPGGISTNNYKSKGYLRWIYSASGGAGRSGNWYEMDGGANVSSSWYILGDSRSFTLMIQRAFVNHNCWSIYSFGVLQDATEDIYKGFILGRVARPNTFDGSRTGVNTFIEQQWNSAGISVASFIMRPYSGNTQNGNSPLVFYIPTKQAFPSGSASILPTQNGKFITLKNFAYDSESMLRGIFPCVESLGAPYDLNTHGVLGGMNSYNTGDGKIMIGIPFETPETNNINRVGFVNLGEYDA